MLEPGGPFLSLASDLDPVDLPDGSIVFRGDGLSVRIEGASAREFVSVLLPLLATPQSVAELASALPQYDASELAAQLDRLASTGVLRREATRRSGDPVSSNGPWFAFLERLGIPEQQARQSLATCTVAIIGLEAHGTHLALQLGHCGIGSLRLAIRILAGRNTSAGRPYWKLPIREQAGTTRPLLRCPASLRRPKSRRSVRRPWRRAISRLPHAGRISSSPAWIGGFWPLTIG